MEEEAASRISYMKQAHVNNSILYIYSSMLDCVVVVMVALAARILHASLPDGGQQHSTPPKPLSLNNYERMVWLWQRVPK